MTNKRKPGRQRVLIDAESVSLYLDRATLDAAKALGDGNVSIGVRKAVQHCQSAGLLPAHVTEGQ